MENFTTEYPWTRPLTLQEHLNGLTLSTILQVLGMAYATHWVYTIIYNLYFHPLSHFPGPRLAAASGWYLCWYEVFKGGEFVHKLSELHEKYGPVVRSAPNELHFSEPEAFKTIYSTPVFVKDISLYKVFQRFENSFTLISPGRHKELRENLAPHFSRRRILEMQGLVQDKIDILCDAWKDAAETGGDVNLTTSIRSATCDIICSYLFGRDFATLSRAKSDFDHPLIKAMNDIIPLSMSRKHFPIFDSFCHDVLPIILRLLGLGEVGLGELQKAVEEQVESVMKNPDSLKDMKHPTIYHDLMYPISGKQLTKNALVGEGIAMLFAGSDTVGSTLSTGTAYLLNTPGVQERLFEELKTAWPDLDKTPRAEELEKLPYLSGVVKEYTRISHGIASALPRITTTELNVAGHWVPPNTQLGVSASFINLHPTLFPDPHAFNPDRWEKSLPTDLGMIASFSRGVRGCIGKQLAITEMTMLIASVYRRFEVEFVQGEYLQRDMYAMFNPFFWGGDSRVRVRVREE